ncbi:A24 family peptidase [Sulfitobacter sp. W002]|uniref:prepilin peptidase n=1 Tax=Sulfitobacter sp. W002 TaxID=2867024 RepID=UPI0021A2DB41|nr:A24 family peptidase [Sulfitobacter sp. W002]UWR29091.1 A24 family peptidase [Sulfitobacter sp. W002]
MPLNADMSPALFLASTAILAVFLGLLVRIDLREKRLPDRYTLPLIVLGLSLNAYARGTLPVGEIWGAIVGYVTFWGLGSLFFRLRGQEGLGLGDAKLLAAAGAWLGISAMPMVVLLAALGALGFAAITQRGRTDQLAFGPWLAAAFFALWVLRIDTVW